MSLNKALIGVECLDDLGRRLVSNRHKGLSGLCSRDHKRHFIGFEAKQSSSDATAEQIARELEDIEFTGHKHGPRLAIVVTHPIQYLVPLYRELTNRMEIEVLFCHRQDAEGQAFQKRKLGEAPTQLMLALPYIMTVLLLAGFVGRSTPPSAIGEPYTK